MNYVVNILSFAFALGIIIFVHEAGHLLAARAFNIRVLAFSLGFGKRIWGFERGGTEYRLSLLPLGGYVKLGGEDPGEESDDPRDFVNRPRWQRIIVYLAGPAMNVVLAIALIAVVFMIGIDVPPRNLPPVVGAVVSDSPAAAAGLVSGDRIVTIDGEEMGNWNDVFLAVTAAPERELTVRYERDGGELTTTVTPERFPRYGFGDAGLVGLGRVEVRELIAGEAAEEAGLKPGDDLLYADGRSLATAIDLIDYLSARPDQPIELTVLREREELAVTVTPRGEPGAARIGAQLGYAPYFQRYPPLEAVVESYHYNVEIVRQTLIVLGKIFTRKMEAKSALSGPIEIAAMSGTEARRGFNYLLHLMGWISVSIALVNLFPVPILDGGQIAILLVETVMRRDLSLTVKERLAQVGFVLIIALMLTVIFFDLQKNLPFLGGT